MKKIILLIILPFCLKTNAQAQRTPVQDSLQRILLLMKEDTSAVEVYYNYGETFENDNPDSATYFYKKAKALAEKLNFKKGIAAFSSHYIVILNNEGKFREALTIAEEALEIYKKTGDKKNLSIAYLNVGSEWEYLSNFVQAADYYLQAKKYADEIGDKRLQRMSNNNLASVFIELGNYEKGKRYAEQSLLMAKDLNNEDGISSSMYNIATAEINLKQPDKALALYKEIGAMGKKNNDGMRMLDGWLGTADAYSALNDFSNAQSNYSKVISFSKEQNTPEYEMYACMGMADVLLKSGSPANASKYILDGIKLAKQMESKLELKDLYLKASKMYEMQGDATAALDYRKQFETLNDSIIGEKNQTVISNLEAQYEFEKKETTIKQLTADNELRELKINQQNQLNYILITGTVVLCIVLLLSYFNYKNKQRLQQQRISELETEKQLTATEAVLKGEEQERTRLAKDLHDGLGGMLSGIKYSFQNMKDNLIMTPENAQAFERSMDMLDSSIKEMRRVAHNMMPEALVKFGLDTALQDFCTEINKSGVLKINYQSIGLKGVILNNTTAITIYRIVQELINNTIKHAAAKNAIVQIAKTESMISVTVEDDGKGFDTSILNQSKGIGWSNIQNRVEFLKGKIDINAKQNEGTSVLIEINV